MTAPSPQPEPIELKCWSVSFQAIKNGTKRFEYRKDDRPYEVGRTLWQREWNPDTLYTGDELYHDITFIINGGVFGIPEGYCIISTTEPRSTRNRPHPQAPTKFPNSTELLLMAHTEWKNRIERKHTHDEIPWVDGWIHGFLTPNKPPFPLERIEEQATRTATLKAPGALERDFKGRYVEDAVAEIRKFPNLLNKLMGGTQ
jgi:hypothetical protein